MKSWVWEKKIDKMVAAFTPNLLKNKRNRVVETDPVCMLMSFCIDK